jgi:hypothetical protein
MGMDLLVLAENFVRIRVDFDSEPTGTASSLGRDIACLLWVLGIVRFGRAATLACAHELMPLSPGKARVSFPLVFPDKLDSVVTFLGFQPDLEIFPHVPMPRIAISLV